LSQAEFARRHDVENRFIEKKNIETMFENFPDPAIERIDIGSACQQ